MASQRKRDLRIEQIRAVEREYFVARRAVDEFIAALERGQAALPPDTKVRDANAMANNLEATYFIRLFAAFESGLRNFYAAIKSTAPSATDLIDAITARRDIPNDLRDDVHAVREFRNTLVHEQDNEPEEEFTIGEARRHLTRFFSYLPPDW